MECNIKWNFNHFTVNQCKSRIRSTKQIKPAIFIFPDIDSIIVNRPQVRGLFRQIQQWWDLSDIAPTVEKAVKMYSRLIYKSFL